MCVCAAVTFDRWIHTLVVAESSVLYVSILVSVDLFVIVVAFIQFEMACVSV